MQGFFSRVVKPSIYRCLNELPYLILAALIVVPLWFIVSRIQGCANETDRALDQGDISYDISPDGNSLVFNAKGEGGRDLYLLDLQTRQVSRIAQTTAYELGPSFSPDGKSIVYSAGNPGERADHIYLRSIDGDTLIRVTNDDANDSEPRFSPEGDRIVFTRNTIYNWGGKARHWGSDSHLRVINADGTGLRQLTAASSEAWGGSFSADGKKIIYEGLTGKYSVAADGSGSSKPSTPAEHGITKSYSPDGKLRVLSKGQYFQDQRLYIENIDGTGRRKLEVDFNNSQSLGGGCVQPIFKPDGKSILFLSGDWIGNEPKFNLWETGLQGSPSQLIADYGLFDDPTRWTPKY